MDGSEIKNLRRILNLKKRELAKKLDVSQATIAQWEKGLKNPGRKNQTELEKLSASIHLSPKETWQSRKPIFQIARDNKPYTIDLGQDGEQLVPMVLIRIPDTSIHLSKTQTTEIILYTTPNTRNIRCSIKSSWEC